MHSLLKENIARHIAMTEEELQQFSSLFTPVTVKRKEHFLREGQVCQYEGYVTKRTLSYLSFG